MFLSISFFASVTLIQKQFHLISFVIFIVFFFSKKRGKSKSKSDIHTIINIDYKFDKKKFSSLSTDDCLSETQSQEIGKTIMRKQSSDCNVSSGPYRTLSSVYPKPSRPRAHGKIVVAIYFLNY